MSYNPELWRTEEYHHFRDGGDLADHGQVVIGNAGRASIYNPIPGMLEHLKDHPGRNNYSVVKFSLMKHFVKLGICSNKDSADVADDVIRWYLDPNCHACHGTGFKNFEQDTCPVCEGKAKNMPSFSPSRKGCAEVESLMTWREIQLRKRNRL